MPIFHECQRCTACCRWPGDVRLSDGEVARLAVFKGMSEVAFIQQFTRVTKDRRGLSLEEKPNGECVFLEGNDCAVQPVKPQQCRDFPNLWNFPGFEKVCHAIPRLVSEEEYRQRILATTGRTLDHGRPLPLPIDGVLDLHTFRPQDVKEVVLEYLAACREKGILEVRIIHGKGIGQLRQTVHAILGRHPDVRSFALAGEAWGGAGATIVHLRPGSGD